MKGRDGKHLDTANVGHTRLPSEAGNVQIEEVQLARIFFVLPEPISLPDGYKIGMTARDEGDLVARPDDPEVSLIFHQVETNHGRTTGAMDALMRATDHAEGLPPRTNHQTEPDLDIQWTVAEAVTPWDSPDPIPETVVSPGHLGPRNDAFMRCLHAAREVVRAYRQATETPYGLPTYVRTISPVLMYTSRGVRETGTLEGRPVFLIRPTQHLWSGPSLVFLDHPNLPDPFRREEFTPEIHERFTYWYLRRQQGSPLDLWRERWLEARRARDVAGEDAQAVILANTSCEVMLDVLLALLMWEDGEPMEKAVPAFEEGKILRRIKQELTPRLKGNWSFDSGAVGDWHRATYKMRHRVVHGGYTPSPTETGDALEAALGLQRFVMDRIAQRRTAYPRAALMTVAEHGLRRRNMWSGQIKRFAEEVAPTESDWHSAYTTYYRDLVAALTP
jgi:hypothetical protein